jgi:hypothetical protein
MSTQRLTCLWVVLTLLSCSSSKTASKQQVGAAVSGDAECDTNASPQMLLSAPDHGYAVTDEYLYVSTGYDLERVSRLGGDPTVIATMTSNLVVTDGQTLFTFGSIPTEPADAGVKSSPEAGLFALPITSGGPTVAVLGASGSTLIAGSRGLYWDTGSQVDFLETGTSSPTTLTSFDDFAFVQRMALGSDYLYMTVGTSTGGNTHSAVRRVPLSGGPASTLLDNLAFPASLALDQSYVYVGDGDGNVVRLNADGSDSLHLATFGGVVSMAVDQHNLYVAGESSIVKIDKNSGAMSALVAGLATPDSLTVFGGNVYWLASTRNTFSAGSAGQGVMTACK